MISRRVEAASTFVVLDLPVPIADEVRALRERYDRALARLPAEITIAGSSGLGTLAGDQSPERVFEVLETIVRRLLPLTTSFVEVTRFPGASVYWLKPRDRAPFDAIQAALIDAGLRFERARYSYTPHCTISASTQLSEAQERRLLLESFPSEEFRLTQLSLYQWVDGGASLVRTFRSD